MRIIEESEILKYEITKLLIRENHQLWPEPDKVGR